MVVAVVSRQPGGEATTLFQYRILGIEAGGHMQVDQADQVEGGGVDQHPANAQLPGGIKQAGRQQRSSGWLCACSSGPAAAGGPAP